MPKQVKAKELDAFIRASDRPEDTIGGVPVSELPLSQKMTQPKKALKH
jgi:hypothetical protein